MLRLLFHSFSSFRFTRVFWNRKIYEESLWDKKAAPFFFKWNLKKFPFWVMKHQNDIIKFKKLFDINVEIFAGKSKYVSEFFFPGNKRNWILFQYFFVIFSVKKLLRFCKVRNTSFWSKFYSVKDWNLTN